MFHGGMRFERLVMRRASTCLKELKLLIKYPFIAFTTYCPSYRSLCLTTHSMIGSEVSSLRDAWSPLLISPGNIAFRSFMETADVNFTNRIRSVAVKDIYLVFVEEGATSQLSWTYSQTSFGQSQLMTT